MKLESEAFQEGGVIPKNCSCEGGGVSPALRWSGVPAGTRAFALLCDDPDAPLKTFTHWVLYNLPPAARELREGVPPEAVSPMGVKQGRNGFGRVGYGGPCPPNGSYHRYYFTLYALDEPLALEGGATDAEVRRAIRGHVRAEASLMGRYQKVPLRTFVKTLLGRR